MADKLTILKMCFASIDVSNDMLQEIAEIAEVRQVLADEIIYRDHEESRKLYIVVSGQVDVQYLLKSGRRKTLDSCFKGDYLLWSALIEPHQTNSIGVCRSETVLLAIDGQKLLEICERNPVFGYRLMKSIASVIRRRLAAARKQLSFLDL